MTPTTGPSLDIRVVDHPQAMVVHLDGELDLANAARLEEAISLGAGRAVAVEMSGVTLVDSTGLRVLLDASRRRDAVFCLVDPSREVRRMLELTLLAATIPVVGGVDAIPSTPGAGEGTRAGE